MLDLNSKIEDYILSHIDEEDPLLAELHRETYVKIFHPRQLSGHLQGKLLEMFVRMISPDRILEIGTFTGYSALCMAKALGKNAELHTIEINDELEEFAKSFFDRCDAGTKIHTHIGDATKIIPDLDLQFDLVFLDGNKSQYIKYYQLVFDKIPAGGYIIADNILWDGKVVMGDLKENDYFTKGILAFNDFVKNDQRVEKVIFPIRDGMFLIRKK
jgi:caffeoyl-CoA O-methyltransferase